MFDNPLWECAQEVARQQAEIERLRTALAEVMVSIEVLAAAGEDAWELAPEVRGELLTARTLGRAALGFEAQQC